MSRSAFWVAALSLSSSLWACDCSEGQGFSRARGKIAVDPEALDFGQVPVGSGSELPLEIANVGTDVLRIEVTSAAGAPATRIEPATAPFFVEFEGVARETGAWAVDAEGERQIVVRFAPVAEGAVSAELVLVHDGSNGPETRVPLRGVGVPLTLVVAPNLLDFGAVTVGERRTLELSVTNPTPFRVAATIPAIPQDAIAFGFEVGGVDLAPDAELSITVPANGSSAVRVWFQPLEAEPYARTLTIDGCASCDVGLVGVGIKPAFELDPALLDFGTLEEGVSKTLAFVVRNIGDVELTVRDVALEAGTTREFVVAPAEPLPTIVLPGAQLSVDVTYTGVTPSRDLGRVVVDTNAWDDPATTAEERVGFVELVAESTGPDIDPLPASINFGTVAIGGRASRALILQNLGNAPLEIRSIRLEGGATELVLTGADAAPATVAPGATLDLSVAYHPTAAGLDEARVVVESSDRDEGVLEIPVSGTGGVPTGCALSIAPSTLNFGLVERGRVASLPAELHNAGRAPCDVSDVRVTGASEFAASTPPANGTAIAPGASLRIDLTYAPIDYGTHSGQLELASNDPAQPMLLAPLLGASAPSDLLVVPSSIDFSVVPVRCGSPERVVTLYNTGSNTITITDVALDAATSSEFQLGAFPTPRALAAGEQATIAVRYRPTDLGTDLGRLVVTHSAAPAPVVIPLEGDSAVSPTVTDTFEQLATPQADVLFVVDNSGSMLEEQRLLGQNLASFVAFADQEMIDYQIGVTTTDVDRRGEVGALVGAPAFLSAGTPDVARIFQDRVEGLGNSGSSSEKGLEAAYLALSDPLINTTNLGFLRPDAALAVVVVSDEEDYSPRDVPFYENFLRNIKGFQNSSLFSFNAVVGATAEGCRSPNGVAEFGSRYVAVAQASGGVLESICNANWGQSLANIGRNSFGLRRQFPLTAEPVPSTVALSVDGGPVPSTSPAGQQNWAYEPATNSVAFGVVSTPPASSVIAVTYSVACRP